MTNGDYLPLVPAESPPRLREADIDSDERCANCTHFVAHECEKYGDYPVLEISVCDSFEPAIDISK